MLDSSALWRRVVCGLLSFVVEIFLGFSLIKESQCLRANNKESVIIIKEISKEGIKKLIDAGIIKNTNKGFVNPKKRHPVGVVKTVHGRRRYIEDWYADMAKKLK